MDNFWNWQNIERNIYLLNYFLLQKDKLLKSNLFSSLCALIENNLSKEFTLKKSEQMKDSNSIEI